MRAPAADAKKMAEVLGREGELDKVTVLTDADATLAKVEDAIAHKLPETTRPGDLVIVYWSGHGGRYADAAKDEQ